MDTTRLVEEITKVADPEFRCQEYVFQPGSVYADIWESVIALCFANHIVDSGTEKLFAKHMGNMMVAAIVAPLNMGEDVIKCTQSMVDSLFKMLSPTYDKEHSESVYHIIYSGVSNIMLRYVILLNGWRELSSIEKIDKAQYCADITVNLLHYLRVVYMEEASPDDAAL